MDIAIRHIWNSHVIFLKYIEIGILDSFPN